AEVMSSCGRRMETVVPAQALALLNSKVAANQARAFAARLVSECDAKPEHIVRKAWLLAFNRSISKQEEARGLAFLKHSQADRLRISKIESGENGAADSQADSAASREAFAAALSEFCLA